MNYIKNENLLGGMLWAVDNDDFNNGNPIISAIYSNLYTTSRSRTGTVSGKMLVPSIIGGVLLIVVVTIGAVYIVNKKKRRELRKVKISSRQKKRVSI